MTDNKIYPGGGAVECIKQTPLVDLLRGVPKDGRVMYEHDPTSHSNIPYGRMCHDAADAIEHLRFLLQNGSPVIEGTIQHMAMEIAALKKEVETERRLSFRNQVAQLEEQLAAVTKERDELRECNMALQGPFSELAACKKELRQARADALREAAENCFGMKTGDECARMIKEMAK